MFQLKQSNLNDDIQSVSNLSINDNQTDLNIPNIPTNSNHTDHNSLNGLIEIPKSNIQELQIGDFIRYTKLDGILMKGGYIADIYNKTNKKGVEDTYIKIIYNKSVINGMKPSGYPIKLSTIIKLYKKVENRIELGVITNNLNGISENVSSDINIIYDLIKDKDTEIKLLKQQVFLLENSNKKNKRHFIQLIEQINLMNNKINELSSK